MKNFFNYTLLNEGELGFLQARVRSSPPGDIIAAGSFRGGDVMAMYEADPARHFVVIDSFRGLADPTGPDAGTHYHRGDFSAGGPEKYRSYFVEAGYPVPPELHELFIDSSSLRRVAPRPIALLWIDLDHYQPTLDIIRHFHGCMVDGGCMITHDYLCGECPGIERAVRDSGLAWECEGGMTMAYQ